MGNQGQGIIAIMEKRTSEITTGRLPNTISRDILKVAREGLSAQRRASVPLVGLINNFDPDQKTFLTDPLKGMTMLQVGSGAGTYGTLAVQAGYGKSATARMDDYNFNFGYGGLPQATAALEPSIIYPEPGKPNLIYPAAGVSPAINTNILEGGKGTARRYYFEGPLLTADGSPIPLAVRAGATFLIRPLEFGSSNTALPPGLRYFEPADYDQPGNPDLYARDYEGILRPNVKTLPTGFKSSDAAIQADDTYWTGTVRDPVNWIDKNFVSFALDTVAMAAYLEAHPGCKLI
jgi:hypothetical protein